MSPNIVEILRQQLYLNATLLIEEDSIRDEWEENIKTYLEKIEHYNSIYEKALCYDELNHCYVMHNTYMKLYENALQANYETVASILNIIQRRKIIKSILDLCSKIDYVILQKHEQA
jgi:hypothetical protein